jgi:hypothetical protein
MNLASAIRSLLWPGPTPVVPCEDPRERLRKLVQMEDRVVLRHLDPSPMGSAFYDEASLLTYFQGRHTSFGLFRLQDRAELSRVFVREFPESYSATLRLADLACRHTVEILGSGEAYLGDPINWHTDFKGGTWAGGDYEALNATLYENDFQNPNYIGDIKLPWELNKHAHFLELAKAYWLTSDERYSEMLLDQMDHWIEQNPFLTGIAWTQNLVVSQRTIAWVLALQAIWQSRALTPDRLMKVLRSLYQHAAYIPVHFEFGERTTNHLIGNAAALAAVACAFPEFHESAEWYATAIRMVESQLTKQVYPDGVHYEQSIGYHRYATEFCLLPWLLSGTERCPYSRDTQATLRRMLMVLLHMSQPTGEVQPISDADGARVWQFHHRGVNDVRSILGLGAALFSDPSLKGGHGQPSEDVLWWLGSREHRRTQLTTASPQACSAAFPHGGYFILRERWAPEALWAVFDCGHIGLGDWPDDVSVGTHGHSDLLSIGLAAGGETLLTDLGSYTYTGSKPWHDYFRSARAHNVVLVDGQDQSVLTTTWAIRDRARPKDVRWKFSPDVDFVTGAHDGYRRLSSPALHRRSLLFMRKERRLIIRDDLEGAGRHAVEALFHGAPSVMFQKTGQPHRWRIQGRNVCVNVRFLASVSKSDTAPGVEYRIAKGTVDPIDGWYASDYGVKAPAPVLHVAFQDVAFPVRLYTVFWINNEDDTADWTTFVQAEATWSAALQSLEA